MSQITLSSLTKKFDSHTVLDQVDLAVEQGEMLALVGPSGSGKTTVLKLISSLLEPTSGKILFNGIPSNSLPSREKGAVIVFQEHTLFPHLSVCDNIGFGLKMRGIPKNARTARVSELLTLVQLDGHGHKYPSELSGGQRQRVAIARALAVEPSVLLLDEPFSSLDTGLKAAMRDFIRQLQKQLGITCLFVTHDTQDALMTADRVAVLFDGRIEQVGTPQEVYQNPATKRITEFFGIANYTRVRLENTQGDQMLRPESIRIQNRDANGVSAIVTDALYCGERVQYTAETTDTSYRIVADARKLWVVGEEVSLTFNLDEAILFDPDTGRRL